MYRLGSVFSVQCSVFRVQGAGCRVQGSGFRVQGSALIVKGSVLEPLMVKGSVNAFKIHLTINGSSKLLTRRPL